MQRVLWFVRGMLLLVLCAGASLPSHASAVRLDHARAELTVDGTTTTIPDLVLPYGWDFHHKGHSGVARFTLEFDGTPTDGDLWALYFFRLGNAYSVRLNGTLLEQNGATQLGTSDTSDYAKVPRLIRIPPSVLKARNVLEVVLRCDSGRRAGMPEVWVGTTQTVEPLYRTEFALRVGGSAVFTVFSLVVGAFAAVLWLTQTDPRPEYRGMRDNLYLYAALAEFSWAFFIGDTLIERPPLPWTGWSVLVNLVLGVWLSAVLLLCHAIAGWELHPASRWTRRLALALVLASPAVGYYTVSGPLPQLLTAWQTVFALVFVASTALFVAQAVRRSHTMHRLVALTLMVNVGVGIHDFYIMRFADSFHIHALLRYSATLFGLALGAIAIDRFRRANLRVRDMLDTLAVRVEDKELELSKSYQRMEQIAREQERTLERARILRDMHDGVGSHISAAIRQLQSGQSNPQDVLLTLRDSLDQLKLSIDALNLPPGDVNALLANLRYRLEPRFRSMGLALEWAVVPLENLARLDASAMRQLQFILFEAFSNVMQHAHASVLRIEATPTVEPRGGNASAVRIQICDNGCGFDATATQCKGLNSMRERAKAIGAQLHIHSRPGETVVEILLG